MPQFTRQSSRPLSPESYRAAARRISYLAEQVLLYSNPQTVRDKQQLTRAIHGLSGAAQSLSRRHRGQCVAAARCSADGHAWVGTGDDRVVCDDCGVLRENASRGSESHGL